MLSSSLFALLAFFVSDAFSAPADDTACYKVTFTTDWNETSLDISEQFSPFVGISHTTNSSLFTPGELASVGLVELAETGETAKILEEISEMQSNGTVEYVFGTDGPLDSPGTIDMYITVSDEFPRVTFVSMISPSPDWFISAEADLFSSSKSFVDTVTIPVTAWDAGSDAGTAFDAENAQLGEPVPISTLLQPLTGGAGSITFQKLDSNNELCGSSVIEPGAASTLSGMTAATVIACAVALFI